MAEKSTYITDLCRMRFNGKVDRAFFNRGEAMRMVYNKEVVFNRAEYYVSVADTVSATAAGLSLTELLRPESYKTDVDGTKTNISYTISPESISPNETEKVKTGSYYVTQGVSGLQVTGAWTQAADYIVGYSLTNVRITGVQYSEAPAGGATLETGADYRLVPIVNYSGTRTPIWASGKTAAGETWGGSTTSLASVAGSVLESGSGVILHAAGSIGYITVPSLGTTPKERTAVVKVTAVSIEVDGVGTLDWSGETYVYQAANTVEKTVFGTPVLTASYANVGADGTAAPLVLTYTQTRTDTYTSTASKVSSLSGTVSNAATSGNYITAISGTSLLAGALLVTTGGSASRGSVSAGSLAYTAKDRAKIYTVSVTASINGQSATTSAEVYQAANVVSSSYTRPEITSVTAGDVGANGSAATISVVYTQSLVTTSTAIPAGKTEDKSGTTLPTTVLGNTKGNNGALSGVRVKADSLGTTYSESRTLVYQVLSVSITVNGMSNQWSGTLNVYQAANVVTKTVYGAYNVSVSLSAASMAATGGTATVTTSCTRVATYTYTSLAEKSETVSEGVTLSTTVGTLSATSFTGSGTATLTVDENTGSARTVTVTATAEDGTTKKTATLSQAAVSYEFYSNMLAGINAKGGTMTLDIVSTRNGSAWAISASNVSVSGISGASVAGVTAKGSGVYTITIQDIPANSGAERTFTIVATQPGSGKTYTWTATQSSGLSMLKAKFSGTFKFGINFSGVNYKSIAISNAAMSATDSDCIGGTLSNLYFKVVGTEDGKQYGISKTFESVSVENNGTTSISLPTLSSTLGTSKVEVEVWYDDELQQTCEVMIPAVSQTSEE